MKQSQGLLKQVMRRECFNCFIVFLPTMIQVVTLRIMIQTSSMNYASFRN